MESRILPYTSSLFLLPSLYGYWKGHLVPSIVLASLTSTSVLYHTYNYPIFYWADQIALYTTFASSFVYAYEGGPMVLALPITGNLWNCWVYFYGYKVKKFVFHEDPYKADLWHATIHILSSLCYFCVLVSISQTVES